MILKVGPVRTSVRGNAAQITELEKAMLIEGEEKNDEPIPLMVDNEFHSGLLSRVLSKLKQMSIDPDLRYTYTPLATPDLSFRFDPRILPGITLRPYQTTSCRKIVLNGGRGILAAGTGAGKTEMAIALCKYYNLRTIFFCDRIFTMEQTYDRFKKYGLSVGRLGGGHCELKNKVLVGVVDSLYSGILNRKDRAIADFVSEAELLLVDEAHHGAAKTWMTVLEHSNARLRIGMSASPFGEPDEVSFDDLRLIGLTGEIVCRIPPRWLIDNGTCKKCDYSGAVLKNLKCSKCGGPMRGYLAEPLVYVHPVLNTPPIFTWKYPKVYQRGVVDLAVRNRAIVHFAQEFERLGKKVLVIVSRIEHGEGLVKMLNRDEVIFSSGGGKVFRKKGKRFVSEEWNPEQIRAFFDAQKSGILIGSCFVGSTKVPLLNGTTQTMKELAGKTKFEVYSRNPKTGWIEGAYATCKKTGRAQPVFKVTLDNGASEICTGSHRWMLRDGTYKRAELLQAGDSLMPLYRELDPHGYEQLYQPGPNLWLPTHRVQAHAHLRKPSSPRYRNGVDCGGWVVHHKGIVDGSYNRADNSRDSLAWMRWKQHEKHHDGFGFMKMWKDPAWRKFKSEHTSKLFKEMWADEQFASELIATRREYWDSNRSAAHRSNRKRGMTKYNKSQAHRETTSKNNTDKKSGYGSKWNDPEWREKKLEFNRAHSWAVNFGWAYKARIEKLRKEGFSDRQIAVRYHCPLSLIRQRNHKVVSVEPCGHEDVYDLCVPGYENFALEHCFVHNSVFDEGVSLPSMNALILAAAGKSQRRTIQRIGRPLHSKDDDFVYIVDFMDMQHVFLKKQSEYRIETYDRLQYPVFRDLDVYNKRLGQPITSFTA